MKKLSFILIGLVLALSLVSCDFLDELFTSNYFSTFYTVDKAQINKVAEEPDAIVDLVAQDPSSFYATLAEDSALASKVRGTIDNALTDPTTAPAVAQQLSVVGATLVLTESGGQEVVDTCISVLLNSATSGDTNTDPTNLVADLIPGVSIDESGNASISDEGALVNLIDSFSTAADYYSHLADNLSEGDSLDPAIAQTAVIVTMVSGLTKSTEISTYMASNNMSAGQYVIGVIKGTVTEVAVGADTLSLDFDSLFASGSDSAKILAAAGLGDLSGLFQ